MSPLLSRVSPLALLAALSLSDASAVATELSLPAVLVAGRNASFGAAAIASSGGIVSLPAGPVPTAATLTIAGAQILPAGAITVGSVQNLVYAGNFDPLPDPALALSLVDPAGYPGSLPSAAVQTLLPYSISPAGTISSTQKAFDSLILAGANLVASSVSTASLALAASLSLAAAPAIAADLTVPAGMTVSGPKTFGGTDKITIGAGGKLTSSSNPTLNQTSASTGVLIDNFGTIESTGAGTRAIRFNSGTAMSFTLTNEAGATIQSQNDALQIGTAVKSGTITVNNYGLIQATGTGSNNGQAIDFGNVVAGTASITINNFATGLLQTADADGIRPGNNATVNNYGQIISNNFQTNTGADAIDFQTSTGGTVNNYAGGVISGGRHGINISYDSAANKTTSSITITNYAGGQIIGRNGSGFGSDVGGTVINYGLISGRIDSIAGVANGDGDGVDIDYIGDITNYGTIEGTGAKGVGSDGKTNTSQGVAIGGGVIDNKAGATIIGQADGILVDNSSEGPAFGPVTITNAGTIEGTTRYGVYINSTLNNTLTNSGTITGGGGQAIVFGSGDDTLNIRTGSVINGTVDGGAGNDRISLSGTGSFAGAINFETLSIDDGVWTLTGTQSYSSGVSVASSAELVAAGTIGNLVTVVAGGRLSGSGALGALDLSGVVSPGSGAGAISTLTVTGNATFRSGSVYQIDANAAGAADKIIVGGTAALAGSVQVTAASGNYAPSTSYAIVQAAGGVSGSFASVSTDLAF